MGCSPPAGGPEGGLSGLVGGIHSSSAVEKGSCIAYILYPSLGNPVEGGIALLILAIQIVLLVSYELATPRHLPACNGSMHGEGSLRPMAGGRRGYKKKKRQGKPAWWNIIQWVIVSL